MYLFVAHYNNTELRHENEEIVREIELDEQQCKSELDVYVLAMMLRPSQPDFQRI